MTRGLNIDHPFPSFTT